MSTTEGNLDRIAHWFHEQNKEVVTLDDALKALEIWTLDVGREVLRNAFTARGVTYASGELRRPAPFVETAPPKADYLPFVNAAKDIIDMAVKPVSVADLITHGGLVSTAVPPSNTLGHHLKRAGVHFIPGIGYWKHPQYITAAGEILMAAPRSKKSRRMMDTFIAHGWPLAGEEIERLTNGEVTSRFMTKQSHIKGARLVKSLRGGLFVPAMTTTTADMPIPMTHDMAEAILSNNPSEPIYRSENVTLYKMAGLLARHRMATVKEGWGIRNGRRQRKAFMELTEAGHASLKGLDRRARKDDF